MDLRTVQYYSANAAEAGRRYTEVASVAARYFPVAFTPESRVLDVGCGVGRDLHALIQSGYDGVGIDGSENMLQEARRCYPALAARMICDTLPFYDLAGAAGVFGPEQRAVDPHDHCAWIRVENHRLTRDMFAIRVEGSSMEPKIHDRSICLFRGGEALAGTRQGRIVLVVLRESVDPENGGRMTVKRYFSEKVFDEDGSFKHSRITLKPLNPQYPPLEFRNADEGTLTVVGEFIRVIDVRKEL